MSETPPTPQDVPNLRTVLPPELERFAEALRQAVHLGNRPGEPLAQLEKALALFAAAASPGTYPLLCRALIGAATVTADEYNQGHSVRFSAERSSAYKIEEQHVRNGLYRGKVCVRAGQPYVAFHNKRHTTTFLFDSCIVTRTWVKPECMINFKGSGSPITWAWVKANRPQWLDGETGRLEDLYPTKAVDRPSPQDQRLPIYHEVTYSDIVYKGQPQQHGTVVQGLEKSD